MNAQTGSTVPKSNTSKTAVPNLRLSNTNVPPEGAVAELPTPRIVAVVNSTFVGPSSYQGLGKIVYFSVSFIDGDDYDLYLVLQNASLASVGTELLFFENGNLSVVVEYSDGDKEVITYGSGLVSAHVTSATVSNGTLPVGVMLEANGTLTVGKASLLVAGTYAFAVTTTDSRGGGTADTVINLIVLSQDNGATYTVEASKPSDHYTDSERIATAADVDGAIVTVGNVTVSDMDQLVAGTSVVTILTTDEQGGTSETIVAITVDEIGNTDHEAIYSVRAAKPVSDYADGQIIATVDDEDGVITCW